MTHENREARPADGPNGLLSPPERLSQPTPSCPRCKGRIGEQRHAYGYDCLRCTAGLPPAGTWADAVTDGPVTGRDLYLVMVPNCPYCGRMHHHRVGRADRLYQDAVDKECPVTQGIYTLFAISRKDIHR